MRQTRQADVVVTVPDVAVLVLGSATGRETGREMRGGPLKYNAGVTTLSFTRASINHFLHLSSK